MKSKLLCIFITILYTISCISYANVDNTEVQSPSNTTSDITIDEANTEINSDAVENQQQDNDENNDADVKLDDSIVQIDEKTFKTSDGLVIFETKPNMSKDEWISYMTNYLNDFHDGTFRMQLKYKDKKFDRRLAERSVGSPENSLNEKQISAVLDMCSTAYTSIVENSVRVDDIIEVAQMYAINKKIPEDEKNFLRLNGSYLNKEASLWNDVSLFITDTYIVTPWGYYYPNNPEKIFSDIFDTIYNDDNNKQALLGYFKKIIQSDVDLSNYENNEQFKVLENLSFDIVVDEKLPETIIGTLASKGSTLKCTVRNIKFNTGVRRYLLELDGNLGNIIYHRNVPQEFDYTTGSLANTIEFAVTHFYDGKDLISEGFVSLTQGKFAISGTASGDTLTEANLTFYEDQYDYSNKSGITAKGTNISYTLSENLNKRQSLGAWLGLRLDELIAKAEEQAAKLEGIKVDGDLRTTDLKGEYEGDDGIDVIDFYVSFITEIDLDYESSSYMPSWYKALGENVKLNVIGVTQTLNGNDRMNYTMLRFCGDKGIRWCDEMTSTNQNSIVGYFDHVITYRTLVGFDGFSKTWTTNKDDVDSLSVYLNFDEETCTLQSIKTKIGGIERTVKKDKINNIGGGELVYEKLW